jgi:hypothetical protein
VAGAKVGAVKQLGQPEQLGLFRPGSSHKVAKEYGDGQWKYIVDGVERAALQGQASDVER